MLDEGTCLKQTVVGLAGGGLVLLQTNGCWPCWGRIGVKLQTFKESKTWCTCSLGFTY